MTASYGKVFVNIDTYEIEDLGACLATPSTAGQGVQPVRLAKKEYNQFVTKSTVCN